MPIIATDPKAFNCVVCGLPVSDHTGPPEYSGGEFICPVNVQLSKWKCVTIEVNPD